MLSDKISARRFRLITVCLLVVYCALFLSIARWRILRLEKGVDFGEDGVGVFEKVCLWNPEELDARL